MSLFGCRYGFYCFRWYRLNVVVSSGSDLGDAAVLVCVGASCFGADPFRDHAPSFPGAFGYPPFLARKFTPTQRDVNLPGRAVWRVLARCAFMLFCFGFRLLSCACEAVCRIV